MTIYVFDQRYKNYPQINHVIPSHLKSGALQNLILRLIRGTIEDNSKIIFLISQ